MAKKKVDFTEVLVRRGVVSPDQIREAAQMSKETGSKLADALVRLGYATGEDVSRAVAEQHGLTYVNLGEVEHSPSVIELVPESVARENAVLPLSESDGRLTVVLSDPMDIDTVDKLRFILNKQVDLALAPREAILEAINRYYGQTIAESADQMLTEFTDTAIDFTETVDEGPKGDESVDEASAPVVRLCQLIIQEAVQSRASDIHIEPFESRIRVRYRIDGQLIERDSPPRRLLGAILSRFKILAKLDIAERRRSTGRANQGDRGREGTRPSCQYYSLRPRPVDCHANIGQGQHSRWTEAVGVCRRRLPEIQESNPKAEWDHSRNWPYGVGQDDLALRRAERLEHSRQENHHCRRSGGILLAGGESGGDSARNRVGFRTGDSRYARQAPNVILVGEMRDLETAQMGIQASLTGHLVFSTLHTNNAPSAITRLVDMGVPAYLVASSIVAIMAQRLVRIICQKCKQPFTPSEATIQAAGVTPEMAAKATFMRGRGCGHCQGGGYRGRLGIYELMIMSSKVRELAFHEAPTDQIRRTAQSEGMRTLYWDGIQKAMKGVTTLEEVFRAAKRSESD